MPFTAATTSSTEALAAKVTSIGVVTPVAVAEPPRKLMVPAVTDWVKVRLSPFQDLS